MADKRISQLVERVNIANNDVLPIVASGATTTNKVTVSTLQDWMQSNLDVGVTSVGLSMPSAFVVSNSPVTGSGNISVTGAGTVSQYIRGDGSLADFPSGGGGGGSSVNYYLNGSVSQGTIGGIAYKEMNRVPVIGAGTDFVAIADGYLASFITDAGDPALLEIPAGNWNFETYFSASSGGGTPSFYVELYKVDSGGTATLIASNSGTPELIAFGTTITPYFSTLAVPTTSLAITDRLALRYYVARSGRTITLHTENSHLCQIITTFTTGLTALNGLTAQVQNFATGTSGTDFAISSSVSTHTFNLPNASASARGVVTTGTQTFAGEKTFSNTITVNTPTNGLSTIYNGRSSDSVNIIRFNSNGASSLQNFIQSTPNDLLIGTEGNTPIYFVTNNGGVGGGLRLTISGSGSILAQGSFEANSIRKTGGTSSQFLKADGSVDSNTYLTTGSAGSTYVPYSGASANVDLGVNTFTSSSVIVNGVGSNSGIIHLESNAFHSLIHGYGSISSGTTNQFNLYQTTGAGVFRCAILSLNSITASATRTYTLPDADGTLALTSNLGAYLPLTGGTLTGPLNGTSASFTGDVGVVKSSPLYYLQNSTSITTGTRGDLAWYNSSVSTVALIRASAITDNVGTSLEFHTRPAAGSLTQALTLASTGAATFSSSVGVGGTNTDSLLTINGTAGTTHERFREGSSTVGFVGGANGIITGHNGKLAVRAESGLVLSGSGNSPDCIIASGGAATFSSSVGVGGVTPTNRLTALASETGTQITTNPVAKFGNTGNAFSKVVIGSDYANYDGVISMDNNATLANTKLRFYIGNGSASTAGHSNDQLVLQGNGNVGIGTASPSSWTKLQVDGTAGAQTEAAQQLHIAAPTTTVGHGAGIRLNAASGAKEAVGIVGMVNEASGNLGAMTFHTYGGGANIPERMRITSGGFTKASNTGTYLNATAPYHEFLSNQAGANSVIFTHRHSSDTYGPYVYFQNAAPNNSTNYFLSCGDNVSDKFIARSNGGLANFQANNVNLSDERTKKDIEPLESYWDKFKAIEIVKFKYKDQTHDDYNIGVIAQQVEAVAPEFVDVDGWETKPKLDEEGNEIVSEEEPLKSIYTADLHHATIKVLQEAMAKIEKLETEIDSLKNQMQ